MRGPPGSRAGSPCGLCFSSFPGNTIPARAEIPTPTSFSAPTDLLFLYRVLFSLSRQMASLLPPRLVRGLGRCAELQVPGVGGSASDGALDTSRFIRASCHERAISEATERSFFFCPPPGWSKQGVLPLFRNLPLPNKVDCTRGFRHERALPASRARRS